MLQMVLECTVFISLGSLLGLLLLDRCRLVLVTLSAAAGTTRPIVTDADEETVELDAAQIIFTLLKTANRGPWRCQADFVADRARAFTDLQSAAATGCAEGVIKTG